MAVVFNDAPAGYVPYFAYTFKVVFLLLPLVFTNRFSAYSLHPLIFIGLWEFATKTVSEAGVVINGLLDHEGLSHYPKALIPSVISVKFAMDALALGATYLGFYFSPRLKAWKLNSAHPKNLNSKMFFIALFGLCIVYWMSRMMGGIDVLALTKGKYVAEALGGGHWNVLAGIVSATVWLSAAYMKAPGRSFLFWLCVILAMATEFLVTASRGGTLLIFLVVLVIFAARKGRVRISSLIVALLVILAGVGLLTQLRHIIQEGNSTSVLSDDVSSGVRGSDFVADAVSALGSYASAGNTDYPIYAEVGLNHPFLLGESYIAILVAPVPRALWHDKPMGVGRMASETFMPSYKHRTGVPPSPAGEAFWNFGVLGVLFIFAIWGGVLKWFWDIVRISPTPGLVCFYIVTLMFLRPHTSIFYNWLHAMVPMLLVLMFYKISFSLKLSPSKRGLP